MKPVKTWQERAGTLDDATVADFACFGGHHIDAEISDLRARVDELEAALKIKQEVAEYEQRHALESEAALAEVNAKLADLRAALSQQQAGTVHAKWLADGYKCVGMLVRAVGHLDGHEMVFRSKLCNGEHEAGHVAKQWAEQCSHPGVSYRLEIAQDRAYVLATSAGTNKETK